MRSKEEIENKGVKFSSDMLLIAIKSGKKDRESYYRGVKNALQWALGKRELLVYDGGERWK